MILIHPFDDALTEHTGLFSEDEIETEVTSILSEYGIEYLCISTTYRWMQYLGFAWSRRTKTFYNNKHEDEAVVKERIAFVGDYLELEKLMFRWVQIPPAEVERMVNEELVEKGIEKFGAPVTMPNGEQRIEFHVDISESFWPFIRNSDAFGGDLSERRDRESKAIIMFGQDESQHEAIFTRYCFEI